MIAKRGSFSFYTVWLGITAEDEIRYRQRWPLLARLPAAIRFVSYEPAICPLGAIDIGVGVNPDWIIVGGESGPKARSMQPDWARQVVADCEALRIAPFIKQWGTYDSNPLVCEHGLSKKDAGRTTCSGVPYSAPANQSQRCMTGNLFKDLPLPAEQPKRITFKSLQHPIWTENKAKLIERYLYYFVLVAKHGAYIDGFAAPQAKDKPDSWAAKLVLESKPPLLRQFWLCDANSKGVLALKELVAAQPTIKGRSIEVIGGDFNVKVADILASGAITEKTATFCLLDQRTFECEWSTVERLARHKSQRKIELFYFLRTGWLDRSIKGTTKNIEIVHR